MNRGQSVFAQLLGFVPFNRFDLPALTIVEIYRKHWQVETFFKWIKQNFSIKHIFGNSLNSLNSLNSVKSQI